MAPLLQDQQQRRALVGVNFSNDLLQIYQIANREDFTPEEANAYWYSREQKSLLQASIDEILVRMETGKRPKQNTSYRGLENFHTSNAEQFQKTTGGCIDAVMAEQDRQWAKGDCIHWDAFREASLKVSKHSASHAYKMAVYDERQARKAYIDMARACQQIKDDDASVSTAMTDTSKSTLSHDIIKAKSAESEIQNKSKSGPPRCQSSGSRKAAIDGDTFTSLTKKKSMVSRAA